MSDNQKKQCIACAQPIYKDAKICPSSGTEYKKQVDEGMRKKNVIG